VAEADWHADYEAASPELKKLIEKELARRNRQQWFQNFMQFVGFGGGLTVVLYVIKVTEDVISLGQWAPAVGGSVLGGATVIALGRMFIHAHEGNATRRLPAKKAARKRALPPKKTPAK
jgi:hypothetical protein